MQAIRLHSMHLYAVVGLTCVCVLAHWKHALPWLSVKNILLRQLIPWEPACQHQ